MIDLTVGLGINIPAATSKFVGTKQAILKGRKMGFPVSGCNVESHTVFP
jgi:hypothetical protein